MWDTSWPMRFYVEDGRLFTVEAPRRTATGWRSIVRVTGGSGEGEYDAALGYLRGCGTAIGFTIRWWWQQTGEWLILSRRRPDLDM